MMTPYATLNKWLEENDYVAAQFVKGMGWYGLHRNAVLPVPIQPPDHLRHEAIRASFNEPVNLLE